MPKIEDDIHVKIGMMHDSYKKLRDKNPDHELLRLVTLYDDGLVHLSGECRKRFFGDGKNSIQGYSRYTNELEKAFYETNPSQIELD